MTSEETTHVDIWGCCLSRDIFGIGTSTGGFEGGITSDISKKRFVVDHFFQECSFAAAFSEHIMNDMEEDDLLGTSVGTVGFYRRCLTADANKTVTRKLMESEAEWIVVDVRTMTYGLLEIDLNGRKEYVTSGGPIDEDTKIMVLKKKNPDIVTKHIAYRNVDNISSLEKLAEFLKARYKDRIILIDGREECDYVDKQMNIVLGKPKTNAIMFEREMTSCLKEMLGCYCIDYPTGNLADENHRWGKSSVHYVSEYYKYALNAIQCIVECYPDRELTEERCKVLLSECEHELELIRRNAKKTINQVQIEGKALSEKDEEAEKNRRILEGQMRERQKAFPNVWKIEDPEESGRLFEEIRDWAEKEDRVAMMHLGRAYRLGRFVDKDLEKSCEWLRRSVSKGNKSAINELFDTLWAMGTEESYAEGIEAIRGLFEENNVNAIVRMGRAYMFGKGVEKDLDMAESLFKKAEDLGSKAASENLKRLHTMKEA